VWLGIFFARFEREGFRHVEAGVKKQAACSWAQGIWNWGRSMIIFGAVVFPLRSSLADWNWVPTGSMKPTILEGDMVFVNKLAYDLRVPFTLTRFLRWQTPAHEDVVVFLSPVDGKRLVKRVIGCPGDTLEMRAGRVFRNGQPLASTHQLGHPFAEELEESPGAVVSKESGDYVSHWTLSLPFQPSVRSFGPVRVPSGQYFVLGDSRDNSFDSRFFGCVDQSRILGRAERVLVSVNRRNGFLPRVDRFLAKLE
jgi:signal peptidase I